MTREAPQIHASSHSSSVLQTVGAVLGTDDSRVAVSTTGYSNVIRYYSLTTDGVSQVTLGHRFGAFSAGVGAQYETDDRDSKSSSTYEWGSDSSEWRVEDHIATVRLGTGFDYESWYLYLSGSAAWPDRSYAFDGLRTSPSDPDRFETVRMDSKVSTLYGVSLRVSKSMSEDSRLFFVASWQDQSLELEGRIADEDGSEDLEMAGYSDFWYSAAAVEFSTESVEQVLVYAAMVVDRPVRLSDSYGEAGITLQDIRRASLGVSIEQPLWRDIQMFAGISAAYSWEEESSTSLSPTSERISANHIESDLREFGWGASKEWRNLKLTGAVSSNLDLTDGFLSLDVSLQL